LKKRLYVTALYQRQNTSSAAELLAQFGFRLVQRLLSASRQALAGAIYVEGQHRQGRAIRIGLPAFAPLRRPLERRRDFARTLEREDAALEIECVAFSRHALGPFPHPACALTSRRPPLAARARSRFRPSLATHRLARSPICHDRLQIRSDAYRQRMIVRTRSVGKSANA